MGKFALLAALLVASAGALNIPGTSGKEHGDDAVFEIHGQQVLSQHHPTEHGQDTFVNDDNAARHEREPPYMDLPKPGGPWHPGPKFTKLTIYEALSADEHYSKLVRLINYDKHYVEFLNDTSHNITFFAPNNHALTFPKHKKGRGHPHEPHDVLANLYEQFESLTEEDDDKKKKILHAILQYHTLPERVIRPALHFNTTFATRLKAKDGSFGGQARRIGVESHGLLPFGPLKINFYAFVLPKEWYTANGVVYTVSRPLLPPPSIIDELYLGNHFFILTSALQKVGLDDWISWEWKKKAGLSEKGATVTFFAPSDYAFRRLPPRLRRFLLSPFGAKALKKILSYHIVPDIILHTDFFYNATEAEDEKPQWHEEELHDTAALAFGPTFLGNRCKSRSKASLDVKEDTELLLSRRRPRFGFPTAGRLPSQERGVPDEEILVPRPPEHEPKTGPLDDKTWPHWPPRLPAPAKFHYTLPTVLEGGTLHVTITKPIPHPHHPPPEGPLDPEFLSKVDVPPGTPAERPKPPPHHPPPHHPLFKRSVTVNGQQTKLEAVARNGAVHTIGRLLNPFKTPHHEPPKGPKGEDDEWADWEDWLPAWAEL